ncbi:MAG: PASTA domain-containing protein [Bacteroidota bacterium]|nr:PASTA domain-containing protein [Bacteroidota bacterium]
MKDLFAFIKTKQFFLHFGIALLLLGIVLFSLLKYLSSYTDHGEFVEVPDFTEKRITELGSFVKDKGINYLIIDSIYAPGETPGIVIKQDPSPKSKVKHNRNIYLYVTSMVAPEIEMPKLTELSERQAKLIVTSYGLKTGSVTTKNADCNGCVIEQLFEGKAIEAGQLIKKGSKINLVVGVRDSYGYSPDSLTGQTADPNTFNGGD